MNKFQPLRSNRAISRISILFVVSLTILSVLAYLVTSGTTLGVDSSALLWINSHANHTFDSFFLVVTELGGVVVVTTVTLLAFIYFLVKKSYDKATLMALGVGGAAGIGYILKAIFERSRPDLWEWLIVESNFSFPSGHAIGSSALALCLVVVFWKTKWRRYAAIGAITYVVVVSFSRLYLGVHYPSDILGGWLLSATWISALTCAICLYEIDNNKKSLL